LETKEISMSSIHVGFTQYRLAGSSAWRRRLHEKFPDDPRNLHAAKALDELARDNEVSFETLAALTPYIDKPAFVDAVSLVAREVGFRCRPETIDHFLRIVAAKLNAPVGAR
jgi:hypothetical protein